MLTGRLDWAQEGLRLRRERNAWDAVLEMRRKRFRTSEDNAEKEQEETPTQNEKEEQEETPEEQDERKEQEESDAHSLDEFLFDMQVFERED